MKIKCEWGGKNKVLVNPDGQVYPCCYLSNTDYFFTETENNKEGYLYPYSGLGSKVMNEYQKHRNELNIKNNTMDQILNNEWWNILESSWQDSDVVDHRCIRYCGVK